MKEGKYISVLMFVPDKVCLLLPSFTLFKKGLQRRTGAGSGGAQSGGRVAGSKVRKLKVFRFLLINFHFMEKRW